MDDPTTPERIASANLPNGAVLSETLGEQNSAWEVATLDDFALVAGGAGGLRVIGIPFTNVISVVPGDGELDVAVESTVVLTFSDQLNPDSVADPDTGDPTGNLVVVEDGTLGPGLFSLPAASAVIDDLSALTEGAALPVFAAGAIEEIGTLTRAGDDLLFDTTAALLPDVQYEVFDSAVLDRLTGLRVPTSSLLGAQLTGRFEFDGPRVRFVPDVPLAPGRGYRVVASTDLVDLAGMPLTAPFQSVFTTVADPAAVRPSILRVEPHFGSIEGGETVTLTGAGFVAGARVSVGGQPAGQVEWLDDRTLALVTPPNVPGPATVEVVNPGGLATRRLGAYLYTNVLRISFIAPAVGLLGGGIGWRSWGAASCAVPRYASMERPASRCACSLRDGSSA